jgi:hypothetical protein
MPLPVAAAFRERQTGRKRGVLHFILNGRSINIAEIALDFNLRMRA